MKITVEFESLDEFRRFMGPPKANPVRKTPLREVELPIRTQYILREAGLDCAEDVQKMTERELLTVPNLGRAKAKDIMAWAAAWAGTDRLAEGHGRCP